MRQERSVQLVQQNPQGRRFSNVPQQQPVYRFPQNQPVQGWQPQQSYPPHEAMDDVPLSPKDKRQLKRAHQRKRRRIFSLWNLFAVIGVVTVIIQAARYIVIPLLVYLNVISGGAL